MTKDEAPNIGRVLERLSWLEKIVVIDSFSTDETLAIVQSFPNTTVHSRAFDTHASQWNYGLSQCRSEWILSLDADYVLPGPFILELQHHIQDTAVAAYEAQFHFLVFGKPLRGNNTTSRPVLFQKALCHYYDDGHTQRLAIRGLVKPFAARIQHDDRKSLSRWLHNQAGYSIKECRMLTGTPAAQLSFMSKLRRKKVLAPFLVFFYCLFVKGLILDGWRGWHYTLQRTLVEILFSLRLIEHDHFKDQSVMTARIQ